MRYKDFTPVVRGFAGGGFGVLTGMLTGVTGAMIFSSTECGGFHLAEATKVSALGQGILLGTVNALTGSAHTGFFKAEPDSSFFNKIISSSAQIALTVFGGMLGYAIEKARGNTETTQDEMSLIVLIGATILVIPLWVINMRASQQIGSLVDSIVKTLNTLDALDENNDSDDNLDEYDCTVEADEHPQLMMHLT